jgi:hypothetical protein
MVKVKEALHYNGSMFPYPGMWSTERWHAPKILLSDVLKLQNQAC